jgi:Na+/proline symporter
VRPLDWAVLAGSLVAVVLYGLWRGRGSDTTQKYLLANRSMPWYAMALSIMATQASAITFISTTGQGYADGMRFVQLYLGLPVAMILICIFVVPRFHRAGVYTAYEYLEQRFDAKTRALASIVFLLLRGLSAGVALSAPAIVLTVIFGWPHQITSLVMGVLVVLYTVSGGIAAVTWTDFLQMLIMTVGLLAALITAIALLPAGVGFGEALSLAGAAGRLNPAVWTFNPDDRYTVFSGLLGGMFLMLSYFGCDQSQVQRYLTGRNEEQSKLSLLFNAVAKIPMQFLILLTGVMVLVFHVWVKPPLLFHQGAEATIRSSPAFSSLSARYDAAFEARKAAASANNLAAFRAEQRKFETVRKDAQKEAARLRGETSFNDTNYIFLRFVIAYLPEGITGLIMAAIFAAAMSTISAEVNSLATVTVIDVYRRFIRQGRPDRHYLLASRVFTAFWGFVAVVMAEFAAGLGSLVEAVNLVGSYFYGALLGVFILAFFFPRVAGTGAFVGILAGEAVIVMASWLTDISFLWFNVLGPLAVVLAGLAVSALTRTRREAPTG